jgi:hypothetical protein
VCDARAAERHIHLTLGRRYHEAREFYRIGCLEEMHAMFDVLGNTPPDVLREMIQKNGQAPVIARDATREAIQNNVQASIIASDRVAAKPCPSDGPVAKNTDVSSKDIKSQHVACIHIYGTFMQVGVTPPTPEYLYHTVFSGHDDDEFDICRDSSSDFPTWSFRIKCAKKQRASHFSGLIKVAERISLVDIFTFEINRRGARTKHETVFFALPGERMRFGGKYGAPMIDYPVHDLPAKDTLQSNNRESPDPASESDDGDDYDSDQEHCVAIEEHERLMMAAPVTMPVRNQGSDSALKLVCNMLKRKEREMADMRREYEAKMDELRRDNDRKLDELRKDNDRKLDEQRKENSRMLDVMRTVYFSVTGRPPM